MKILYSLILFSQLIFHIADAQLSSAQKLIVTITDDWNSNTGTVYLFDRSKDLWKKQPQEFSASVGRNGLGWGDGLHPVQKGEFIKHEGDDRSPAGIFELDTIIYGISAVPPNGIRFPYQQVTAYTRCVDDSTSLSYNLIVEENRVQKDWSSSEHMQKITPDYTFVLVVKHNSGRKKGKGSCIFFHTNNVPTSGCTSMNEEDLVSLMHWLDPKRPTLIIQLPKSEYRRLHAAWGLPDLPVE